VIVLAMTPVVERAVIVAERGIEGSIPARLLQWEGTLNMIKDNWLAGTGPGTYAVAYPPYQLPGQKFLQVYAHNDYLQFSAESGILAIPLMLWLMFLFFRAGVAKFKSHSRQTSGIALGCMAAVIAVLIHSYSDGNLRIPANAILFTAITALTLKSE
jgi:O-antigen ligase